MSADPTLAIDLGGTKTLAGLVLDGRVVESRTQPTDREASAETWLDTIAALADGWRNRFEAVAIAVSGVVVDGRWSSLNPGVLNVPDDFPLVARLNDRLGVPVLAVNDAQAAAWGEFRHGAGNGADSIVFITVSTGLGGGVVLNRELLIGSSGLAGSFGQFAARVEGAGRLEDSLSGQWIASQSAWLGYQNDTAWVIDAANRGEAWADEIIETSVTRFGGLVGRPAICVRSGTVRHRRGCRFGARLSSPIAVPDRRHVLLHPTKPAAGRSGATRGNYRCGRSRGRPDRNPDQIFNMYTGGQRMTRAARTRLLVATALTAMLAPAGGAMAEVTVLGWPGGPEEEAIRVAAEAYNALPDTADADKVEVIFFNRDGFWDKLQADMGAGTTEFDINLTATYAVGRYSPFMTPLDLPDSAVDVFGESVLKTMQYEGVQYGVPVELSLHFMYFRSDLIDELLANADWQARYGEISAEHLGSAMTPKHPDEWSWDDYAATALFFTQSINEDSPVRYGTVLQMKNLLFNMMIWHSTARSEGGDWMNADGEITVDSDAFRQGLELYKMLYDAGASPRDSLSYEYAEANSAFGSGQAATMLQWNAAATDLLDPEKTPAVADVTGTVAPPSGSEGRFTHIHGLGFGINANSENMDGAKRFLDWLSSEEAMLIYAVAGGSPALAPAVAGQIAEERPPLVSLGGYAGDYGFVMNGGTSANALSIYELQAQEFTGYWAGEQSLDEALANAEAGMADLLK